MGGKKPKTTGAPKIASGADDNPVMIAEWEIAIGLVNEGKYRLVRGCNMLVSRVEYTLELLYPDALGVERWITVKDQILLGPLWIMAVKLDKEYSNPDSQRDRGRTLVW